MTMKNGGLVAGVIAFAREKWRFCDAGGLLVDYEYETNGKQNGVLLAVRCGRGRRGRGC